MFEKALSLTFCDLKILCRNTTHLVAMILLAAVSGIFFATVGRDAASYGLILLLPVSSVAFSLRRSVVSTVSHHLIEPAMGMISLCVSLLLLLGIQTLIYIMVIAVAGGTEPGLVPSVVVLMVSAGLGVYLSGRRSNGGKA